ncbi:MAG: hypothetical protein IT177_24930 [Acidobacteria bacterium]|nr:hypothetical protein [Acidobacteriota bacterium]
MSPERHWPEVGRDALDAPAPPVRRRWLPRRRLALGVGDTLAPSLVFIAIGVLLGPSGINVLSPGILGRAEPLVSVALAVLGVFVGVGTTTIPRAAARDAYLAGGLGFIVTTVGVAGGLWFLLDAWAVPLPIPAAACAAFLGIAASASAVTHAGQSESARRVIRMADVDDVPLIVFGSVAVAWLGGEGSAAAALRLAATVASGAGIGLAGWLLFERATGTPERGVFVTGTILLMAGTGMYLGTSPLLTGFVAALVWVRAPGVADRIGVNDLRVLQHPLLALLLIVAGATIEWTLVVVWAAVATLLLRLVGKILASVAVAPLVRVRPGLLATALLPPGVLGIALAINASHVLGGDSALLVGIATTAAAASEALAMFLPGELEDEA